MKYVVYLITFLMLFAAPASADEVTRYRVEVLVFSHLGSEETPDTTLEVRDYSDALDFLSPRVIEADPCGAVEDDGPTMAETSELGPLYRTHEPNEVIHLDEAGPEMAAPEMIVTSTPYPGASRSEEILVHPALSAVRSRAGQAQVADADWICGTPIILRAVAAMARAHDMLEAAQ